MRDPTPPPLGPGERALLEVNRRLGRADRKRIIPFAVEVPAGLETLAVWLDYRPRWCKDRERNRRQIEAAVDLQLEAARGSGVPVESGYRDRTLERLRGFVPGMRNLLNLTLRDPRGGDRGRWDQNLESVTEDLIGRDWASPGFVAGPLVPGRWTASLEVHEILTEECELTLRIAARARPATGPGAGRAELPAASREYARLLPAGWLRGELHCHSTCSDGRFAPELLVERAQAVGLDFLALTDHNNMSGLRALEGSPLTVIPGCEITTLAGHFPCLGELGEALPWYLGDRVLGAEELAAAVHARGGLFGLAHPYVLGDPICVGCRLQIPVRAEDLDLLEVWSRGPADPLARLHALAFLDELWLAGRRVTAVAGRDWHGPAQEAATSGQRFPATCVRAAPEVPALLAALRRGACYLSVGPRLELGVESDGLHAGLGEELPIAAASTAVLQIALEELEEPARLRIIADGACLREERLAAGSARLEHEGLRPLRGGLRVELWGESGDLLLCSSPLALEVG